MARALRRAGAAVLAFCGLLLLTVVVATGTGAVRWVVTTGDSMAPRVRSGDAVVVRPADRYTVGDVVAYRNPDLGQTVLHRIVAIEDGRFVTKGDHNGWVDSYRPVPGDLLGRERVHLPGAGRRAEALRQPWLVAVIVGMTSFIVLGGGTSRPRRGASACAVTGT